MPPTPSNGPNVSEKTEVHFCEGGLHFSQAVLLNFTQSLFQNRQCFWPSS